MGARYPFTTILENDSTAVPVVGRPMESAGWNVVKISRFFNCGSTACRSAPLARLVLARGPEGLAREAMSKEGHDGPGPCGRRRHGPPPMGPGGPEEED